MNPKQQIEQALEVVDSLERLISRYATYAEAQHEARAYSKAIAQHVKRFRQVLQPPTQENEPPVSNVRFRRNDSEISYYLRGKASWVRTLLKRWNVDKLLPGIEVYTSELNPDNGLIKVWMPGIWWDFIQERYTKTDDFSPPTGREVLKQLVQPRKQGKRVKLKPGENVFRILGHETGRLSSRESNLVESPQGKKTGKPRKPPAT